MTRGEFLSAAPELVGEGKGMLARYADLLGVSRGYVYRISQGFRDVPEAYADRLRAVREQSVVRGEAVTWLSPRLQRAVGAAVEAGWEPLEAVAAVAAWAGLRLTGAVPLDRSPRPRR